MPGFGSDHRLFLGLFIALVVVLSSCQSQQADSDGAEPTPSSTALSYGAVPSPAKTADSSQSPQLLGEEKPGFAVYHPNPDHLWNHLFNHFYGRTAPDGQYDGLGSLDPLLWLETTYLLQGESHEQALALLDEFLLQNGEDLIAEPRKRAMLQRDLWAVFDWSTLRPDDHSQQRQALQERLAMVMQRLALSREQIQALPDNYQMAIVSEAFPSTYQEAQPETAFLPPDLFAETGDWLNIGRNGGPMAMTHVSAYPFLGRSTFLVFIRVPGGRETTEVYVQSLREAEHITQAPLFPVGIEVALVRHMMLIDDQGELVLSPLVESVQLRHARPDDHHWEFYEFELDRESLFTGETGGLRPLTADDRTFALFRSHGIDPFESDHEPDQLLFPPLDRCDGCHGVGPSSILSYSRHRFPLPDEQQPLIIETTPAREAQLTAAWKKGHESWQMLQNYLSR